MSKEVIHWINSRIDIRTKRVSSAKTKRVYIRSSFVRQILIW
jgi:hypothetical protein